jgi:hypothetical protein
MLRFSLVSYLCTQCKTACQANSSPKSHLTFYRFFTPGSHLLASMKVRKPQWLGGYYEGRIMSELTEIAILAYRNGRYKDAVDLLLQVTDADSSNWMAKLYLGMSYEKSGRAVEAHRLFKRMSQECPDEHLRTKAENALPLVEAEMRRRFVKEPLQAPAKTSKSTTYNDDVVWVG